MYLNYKQISERMNLTLEQENILKEKNGFLDMRME